jgi:NADPH2:quinone reductase
MENQLPKSMRYIDCPTPGGPEVLKLSHSAPPSIGDEEVLIQVKAAGVNRPDLLSRMGKYPPPPGASPILGLEVSGIVVQAGKRAKMPIGSPVCALTPGGGYAEYCAVPGSHCLPLPKTLDWESAAGIPETFFTVWANVFQTARLQPNERFLVHGGSSGIGTAAIQLARAFGAIPYATAGSAEKCAACVELGAEAAINYKTSDFQTELKRLTHDRGIDVILDMVGGPYTPKNIDLLAPGGRLVQIATQLGHETTVDLAKIMRKRLTLTGSTLRPRSIEDKALIASELHEKVWPLIEAGKVGVRIDRIFPLEEAADAHRYLEGGAHVGKIILTMASR